ncbi:hypothetical protein DXG01_016862 [Tephrocybe rancida]|nr:hypothetical protein DXG01_016862 [Tephrocybe rancida]
MSPNVPKRSVSLQMTSKELVGHQALQDEQEDQKIPDISRCFLNSPVPVLTGSQGSSQSWQHNGSGELSTHDVVQIKYGSTMSKIPDSAQDNAD